MSDSFLVTRVTNWLLRRTTRSAVRRVGEHQIAIASDIGSVRSENQDRAVVARLSYQQGAPIWVAVLSDGMGGMEAGGLSAAYATSIFITTLFSRRYLPLKDSLQYSVQAANEYVYSQFKGNGGATLSAVVFGGHGSAGVNVGDSRIYATTAKGLLQLTTDDTFAAQLPKAELAGRNDLLQFVGLGKDLEPHFIEFSNLSSAEKIILTSDGVHQIEDSLMATIIRYAEDEALAAKRLVDLARWMGGKDNASIVAIDLGVTQQLDSLGFDCIELWDAFGEAQMFLMPPPSRDSISRDVDSEKVTAQVNKEPKEVAKKKKKVESAGAKKRGTASAKQTVLIETDVDVTKEPKPQLKIEFDPSKPND